MIVVEPGRKGVLDVEQWAEIRRMRFVEGLAIREIARRTGRDRKTIRRALRAGEPPRYQRPAAGSKLDPVKEEIHRLLLADPRVAWHEGQGADRRAGVSGVEDAGG
jgi:transposase